MHLKQCCFCINTFVKDNHTKEACENKVKIRRNHHNKTWNIVGILLKLPVANVANLRLEKKINKVNVDY